MAFVVFGTFCTEYATRLFTSIKAFISHSLGGFYHGAVSFCLVFCLCLCFGRWGRIRLGADHERPVYGYLTWFAMLFSAGMGIGVLFWSVAEPITHFSAPPVGDAQTDAAADLAMDITLLHWGLHGWCLYVVVGLGLAYTAYRCDQPLTFRSVLYPLAGKRIHGGVGNAVDIFAILGTMFGVATSLGMGAQQINSGLHHLFGTKFEISTQLAIIAGITLMATASVVSGLDRGIRRLSQLAVGLALPLFVYIVYNDPTDSSLSSVTYHGSHYLQSITKNGFWSHFGGSNEWQGNWTVFYWGWWIAWSPFVGMFVARISRGRTVREFVLGVLLVPSAVTCIWFCVFGGIGLEEVRSGNEALADAVSDNFSIAIFVFFKSFPWPNVLCGVGLVIIVVFFVTSSDSASLVIDYIAAGGHENPPKRQRIFWAGMEGVVAAVLLIGGGIEPMRVFQLITGLPLAVILLLICGSIVKGFLTDSQRNVAGGTASVDGTNVQSE